MRELSVSTSTAPASEALHPPAVSCSPVAPHPTAGQARVAGSMRMRAAVREHYGSPGVVAVQSIEPREPGPGEVRIRVRASSVNAADWFVLTGRPWLIRIAFGLLRPKSPILGMDVAGIVESVGPGVTRLRVGDAVFGEIGQAYAELACGSADRLAVLPDGVPFDVAAAVPVAGVTAWQALHRTARVRAGHRVCVVGASGGVGTFAVQIAAAAGAEVTGVAHGRSLERVRSLGAAHVVDRTRVDYTQTGARYDIIVDLVGCASLRAARRCLRPGGVYVSSVGRLGWVAKAFLASLLPGERVAVLAARPALEDLAALGEWVASGRVVPAIDRRYRLDEVAEALREQGEGRGRGKAVIVIGDASGNGSGR